MRILRGLSPWKFEVAAESVFDDFPFANVKASGFFFKGSVNLFSDLSF